MSESDFFLLLCCSPRFFLLLPSIFVTDLLPLLARFAFHHSWHESDFCVMSTHSIEVVAFFFFSLIFSIPNIRTVRQIFSTNVPPLSLTLYIPEQSFQSGHIQFIRMKLQQVCLLTGNKTVCFKCAVIIIKFSTEYSHILAFFSLHLVFLSSFWALNRSFFLLFPLPHSLFRSPRFAI